jgi:hypothetical protein
MSATNSLETGLLALLFNGDALADVAQNDGSSPQTVYYVSLHTASPGEAGSQNTSEAAYTGYARVAVNRNSGGWTVSGDTATNAAAIEFGQCTASPGSAISHVGLGKEATGAGTLQFYEALTSSITMQVGATPLFSAGELDITCN